LKAILLIALERLTTAFRERTNLFWFIVFPMLLLALLTLIFGNIGRQGQISFRIALANMDSPPFEVMDLSALIESVFEDLSMPTEPGKEGIFALKRPEAGESKDSFVQEQIDSLRLGDLSALVVIPLDLSQKIMAGILDQDVSIGAQDEIKVYYDQGSASSEMAVSIIEQVFSRLDREIFAQTGRFNSQNAIPVQTDWLGSTKAEISYINFLLPGVILMAFFVAGLFAIPEAILLARDRQILRRYWVTPLNVVSYISGFSLGHVALCILQFFLLYLLATFAFGASLEFNHITPVAFLLLSSLSFLSFGFLISSIAKTANAGMAIANILNMPMLFLGGLFFPIGDLPLVIKAITFINPITYLAQGLRVSLGVETGTIPSTLTVVVPLSWILICLLISSKRLTWDVRR